jgi:16S rRNA pseudouridine516 synthase
MSLIRLDKYLSDMTGISRSQIKKDINSGKIIINNNIVKDSSHKINTEKDIVLYNGEKIEYKEFVYIMLNKPKDVVTANKDNLHTTVMDLIDVKRSGLSPVGRLDKDTEGLLLITDDGELSHNLLSPKKHVDKEYFVRSDEALDDEDIKKLTEGVYIEDGLITKEALLKKAEGENEYLLIIREGKFHQVKRMFYAVSKNVVYLKRLRMGSLILDENLKPGEYRELTADEIKELKGIN